VCVCVCVSEARVAHECSEFEMAEIEHFVDPTNKNHPKFKVRTLA
jgi:glycyl-tRNA synthetase (class II)